MRLGGCDLRSATPIRGWEEGASARPDLRRASLASLSHGCHGDSSCPSGKQGEQFPVLKKARGLFSSNQPAQRGAGSLGPGHPGRWACGGAMPTPGRPGGASWKCGLGRKPAGQQKGKKKWLAGRGRSLPPRPWIPPSGDKNSEWPRPARTPLPPTLSPSSGRQRPAGQRPSRPLPVPLSYVPPGRISPTGLPGAPSSYSHPALPLSPAPVCLCDFFFRMQSKACLLLEAFLACI